MNNSTSGVPTTTIASSASNQSIADNNNNNNNSAATPPASSSSSTSSVPHIRIVPHLDAPRSLHFEVVDKDVPDGFVLKIGRFTDKQTLPNRVTFKSKVVSRGHAEIYTELGKFYIRDTKSSSGTFLNHARLSPPGVESKPAQLKDGDVVQLGVDYQGGTQEIYRCVKMRLELNRSWQQQANPFRLNTLKVIRNLTTADAANSTDCCICLFRIASFQSLFVAPCSHVYHYKCIRPMLVANHPGFLCPLCRTFADLEDTVEIDDPIEQPAAQNNAVEQVEEEPVTVANPDPPVTTPIHEHSTIPTSTSTSTPPEDIAQESPIEDMEMPAVTENAPHHGRSNSAPASPTSIGAPPASSGASATPLQITIPQSASGSQLSVNLGSSSSQQSPSSAFFLAPSPPAFISGFGVSPIPFSTPSSSSSRAQPSSQAPQSPPPQSHNAHSVSPSNHMSHMFQNFVRNITIPSRSRSRSRTNSNSASLSPVALTTPSTTPSQGTSHHHGILSHLHLHHHHNNEGHADVFGKTLVVSPTPVMMSNARHNISELGSVSEMESEPVSRDDSSSSSGRSSRGGDEMSDDIQTSGQPSTTSLAQVTPSEAQPVVV
ncbi:hypothetical protein MVEG_06626 [Podila verticillata NRRL 6337]|nr:hypothetical protein MVEG_06626 [Podila verticillata NRRL 6337]